MVFVSTQSGERSRKSAEPHLSLRFMKWPLLALVLIGLSTKVSADTPIAQAGPDPIVFDQTATRDNLIVLMAAASAHNSGVSLYQSGGGAYPKHFWINNWNDASNDYFKWNISLASAAGYHVYAKLTSGAVVPMKLTVEGTTTVLSFSTRAIGWDRLDAGVIDLPAGASTLMLKRDTAATDNVEILSLELIRESDVVAYEERVSAFRAESGWFSRSKYGLMFQMGPWGYPATGPRKSMEDSTNAFDVPKFVAMVKETGAGHVIWSMTWWTYQVCAPIQSIDAIVGNGNRTSTRDLIGEIATALKQEDIRFMLYYHTGQDSHLGYNSTDWWQAQQFPAASFTNRGTGDRSVFFNNWVNVITEVGNRYGKNLDGWFFDDGLVYYPAPFERLGEAARAGNPDRLISYNPWVAARHTDFQDVFMGENYHGEKQYGSAPAGGDGIFTDGPLEGLLQQSMFTMENDWGVHGANQPIQTNVTASQARAWVKSAASRGVPLSFNLMMWEDGTCSPESLAVFTGIKNALEGNLVTNGEFEGPETTYFDGFVPGATTLTGWQVPASPPDGVQLATAGTLGNSASQTLQLTGGTGNYTTGGRITQTLATVPGDTYQISIDVAARQGTATVGDFTFGDIKHTITANSRNYITLTWQAKATSAATIIDISGAADSANNQLLIDNVIVIPAPDSFSQWRGRHFTGPGELADLTISGPDATPMADGVNNLLKYAFGLDPKLTAAGPLLSQLSSVSLDAPWTLQYHRPANRPDLVYRVQVSPDLSGESWTDDNVSNTRVSSLSGNDLWEGRYTGARLPSLFARVRVESR